MSTFARMSRSEIIHGRAAMVLMSVLVIAKSLI
ncbi:MULTISPECIES: chlorophyll a-b binding domain-containing protein [Prochlorococcus]|nr:MULTISPECIES: chlorophyll a-b binding domain-containing protein [Prochlorococcus]